MTLADVYTWFWNTPGATWDDWLAQADAVAPLRCVRDSAGDFVRDGNGVIRVVEVASVSFKEVKAA